MDRDRKRRRLLFLVVTTVLPTCALLWLAVQLLRLESAYVREQVYADGIAYPQEVALRQQESRFRILIGCAAVAFVFSATLVSRYILWQDVRQEGAQATARSRLAAALSHELRTPLTTIRMYADTLALGHVTSPESRQEYLETISRESRRLSATLDNVLRYTRLDSGAELTLARTSLVSIARETLVRMHPVLDSSGFEAQLRQTADPDVMADASALSHAIENLLENAIKYSGEDRNLEVRVGQSGGTALVEVADHGVGVPESERQRIFDEFYRVPRDGSAPDGAGLGLALVQRIVQAHRGSVAVTANQPSGSVFTLRLPLVT